MGVLCIGVNILLQCALPDCSMLTCGVKRIHTVYTYMYYTDLVYGIRPLQINLWAVSAVHYPDGTGKVQ